MSNAYKFKLNPGHTSEEFGGILSVVFSNPHSRLLETQLMAECGGRLKHDIYASVFIGVGVERGVSPTVSTLKAKM